MAQPEKLYWDSCAWIGFANKEPDKKKELLREYKAARDGRYEIWTSSLSLIELRWLVDEKGTPRPYGDENDKKISLLFHQPYIKIITMTVDIVENARQIWRKTPSIGKYADAIHVASALRWNISVMHTYDRQDLLDISKVMKCQNGEPLTICYPGTDNGPLFEASNEN